MLLLPAEAQDVWLVCPTSAPREVGTGTDNRPLELCLAGLKLDDGVSEPGTVALYDIAGRSYDEIDLAVVEFGDKVRGEKVDVSDRDILEGFFSCVSHPIIW